MPRAIPRLPLAAFAAALVFALAAGRPPALAQDAKPSAAAKHVKLVHVATGKVLAVADDSDEAGAKAVLAKDEASQARQWRLEKDGEHLKVVNRKTGKVLDVFEASADEGADVIQWDEKADDTDNQRWAWAGDGAERRLKSKASGLVLDADADGRVTQKKADEKVKGQLWRVVDVKD